MDRDPPMSIHVAILMRPYLRLVLAGRKTIESRLSKTAVPPYGQIEPGERIYFKASGGPFMATAIAAGVVYREGLTPARVAALRRAFNDRIGGDDRYWQWKRDSRYATLVHLRDVSPIDVGPTFPASPYKAWFVLPEEVDPMLDVTLTAGAIRNRYVPVAGRPDYFGGEGAAVTLELPDGTTVHTDLYRRSRLRWRGWGRLFEAWKVEPGDRLRFVAVEPGRYRVTLVRHA